MGFYVQEATDNDHFEVRSKDGNNFLVGKFATFAAANVFVQQLEGMSVKVFTPVSLLLAAHHAINCGCNYETFLPEWLINTIDGFETALKDAGIPFVPIEHKIPAPKVPP